jgi:predicted AlkP superfamily phosphohydrolase/phosphomutase/Flp pilus assembly protein TadD
VDPIVVVGIDGAEWRILQPLLDQGKLPNLEGLVREGVSAPLTSLKPLISPIIWTTIATGKGPDHHQVLDFTMPDPKTGMPIPMLSLQRQVKAFWNIFSEKGISVGVLGWWATWPAEEVRGCIVSDRLTSHAFIQSPEATTDVTYPGNFMNDLRGHLRTWEEVSYETARNFLEISREEYESHSAFDFKDPVTHFRHIHASMANIKEAALRAWETFHPEVLAVYFEGVDTASHLFVPYAPPPYPYATPEERRRYRSTVDSMYVYQDRLLGEILSAVGPRARVMVISDHGFLSGEDRPLDASPTFDYATAAKWHRIEGVLILHGPGIRKGARLDRATVFDVTPTLLYMAGLPVGGDMEGRVLREAFEEGSAEPEFVETYDEPQWRAQRRRQAEELVTTHDPEIMEKLRSLGYVGSGATTILTSPKGRLGLAEYLIWKGEGEKAERELHEIIRAAPDYADAYYHLGLLKLQARELSGADSLFRRTLELEPKNLAARQNLAYVVRSAGDREGALELMEETREMYPMVPQVLTNISMLYREAGLAEKALDALEEAMRLEPNSHAAHAQTALTLESLERWDEAREAWRRTLEIKPDDRIARERLARLEGRSGP